VLDITRRRSHTASEDLPAWTTVWSAPLLARSVRDGLWTPATSVDEYLVVHGGLHPMLAQNLDEPLSDDAAQVAAGLRAAFERRVAGASAISSSTRSAARAAAATIMAASLGATGASSCGRTPSAGRRCDRSSATRRAGACSRTADGRFSCVDVGAALSGSLGGLVRDPGGDWLRLPVGGVRRRHV
jgi:hypothetical protein